MQGLAPTYKVLLIPDAPTSGTPPSGTDFLETASIRQQCRTTPHLHIADRTVCRSYVQNRHGSSIILRITGTHPFCGIQFVHWSNRVKRIRRSWISSMLSAREGSTLLEMSISI